VEAGCRVLRSEPAVTEADASFAGLSDLLSVVLPGVAAGIPPPQLEALETALLLRPAAGRPPAASAVGLAVLSALRSCLSEGPVLIAIDDVQWLDADSLGALTFALRRIHYGPLGVLITARTDAPGDPLTAGAPPPPHRWRDLQTAIPAAEQVPLGQLDGRQIQSLPPRSVTAGQVRLVTVEQARSLLVLGRIERRRKARGQARDALGRAETLALKIGHRPLLDQIRRELPRTAAARSGDGLTAAEQRVADQIAAGATSQEAAAALFISVRTVETHVASIYRKLGVRTRSEFRRALSARPAGRHHATVPGRGAEDADVDSADR